MQIVKRILLTSLPAALLFVSMSAAHAERPGLYIGASGGAYSVNESDLDENDHLVKAHAGLQLSNWFGIEGNWVDFNRVDQTNSNFEADGWGLSGVISFPFSETSSFFIKGGNYWWEADTAIGGAARAVSDGDDPFWGAGLKLGFTRNVALRLEYERYEVANINLDTVTAGLQINF